MAVALLIGIWLVAVGTVRLVATFESHEHRLWNGAVAVVDILAGIVIVSSPGIGLTTLALLVGISFIAHGIAFFMLGWQVRGLEHEPPAASPHAGAPA
jgi:uncharacterized membrane protein HdeD (DUF308 family)